MKSTFLLKSIALLSMLTLLLGGVFMGGVHSASADAPNLSLVVHPQYDLLYAFGWDRGVELTLSIAGAEGHSLGNFTAIVGDYTYDPTLQAGDFSYTGFNFQPGQVLTVSGNGLTKTYTIQNPKITEINIDAETISGTGTPGDQIQTCANLPDTCITRWATIDESGNWTVSFGPSNNPFDSQGTFDLQPGSTGWADEVDAPGDQTWADDWRVSAPFVYVNPYANSIFVTGMPIGTELTLTIKDGGDNVLFTSQPTQMQTNENSGFPNPVGVFFDMQGFDVEAGQVLTTSAGDVSSTYTVTDFQITAVDPETDTITGVATPDAQVEVGVNLSDHDVRRHPTVDGDGNWVADFQNPGARSDEQETTDIQPGSSGWGNETDFLSNQTWSGWSVPNLPGDIHILANPTAHWVYGIGWPLGVDLTLTIGDYLATATTVVSDWDQNTVEAYFDLSGQADLAPGNIVTITGADITRTLVITNFSLTNLDVTNNTLAGIAYAGESVCAYADAPGGVRCTTADQDGLWSMPSDPEGFVLAPGVSGPVVEFDPDGDQTRIDWSVPNPTLEIHPQYNIAYAFGWDQGVEVTMSIADEQGQPLKELTVTVGGLPWDPTFPTADFSNMYDFQPGQVLTVSGNGLTKTYTIQNPKITQINADADTIKGSGTPGDQMHLCANLPDQCIDRWTMIDEDGNWVVDFTKPNDPSDSPGSFDLQPNSSGWAVEIDAFGDQTWADDWSVPNPTLEVHPQQDWVYAFGWDKGVEVTLSIADAQGNPLGDYTVTVGGSPWDPNYPRADFTQTGFDFQPGQVLTVSGNGLTKTYTIQNPKVTKIDLIADTIRGTGTAGDQMHLCANLPDQCFDRWTTINEDGNWEVNFKTPSDPSDSLGSFTLQPGSTGWSVEIDASGDQTWPDGWWQPILTVNVSPQHNTLYVYGLDIGYDVTLSIGDAHGNLLAKYTAPVVANSYDPNFPQADFSHTGFDFKPGQILTVSWSSYSKTYTIQNPKVTKIDVIADTISGTGTPGDRMHLCANLPDQCIERWTTIDGSGIWVVDFKHPTDPSDSPGSFDLQPGSDGWADEINADWDQTWADDWVIPSPNHGSAQGEGWFNSPAGVYPAKPGFSGKAAFVLDVKYGKKSPVPQGKVQFAFTGFTLTSSSFDWMAIAGGRMQLTGSGKVNGTGSYGFMIITAGKIIRGVEKDTIRIRVWRKDTGKVVYDNMPGAADNVVPVTPVVGCIQLNQ